MVVTGPRQSGKSTLVRAEFAGHRYANLERVDTRAFALEDPLGFLSSLGPRAVIDEVQQAPALLSAIQVAVDEDAAPGRYVLTGSQNFQLLASVSQSLAGRAAVRTLLPLSLAELTQAGLAVDDAYVEFLYRGFYPRIYDYGLHPHRWLEDYVATYVERDIRALSAVQDLNVFRQFVGLLAGRNGHIINASEVGGNLGVDYKTVQRWIGLLEVSYVVYRVLPYHRNYAKRVLKKPKLYFYDVGLAAMLQRVSDPEALYTHPARSGLFEALVLGELMKAAYNAGKRLVPYFWNAANRHEVDFLFETARGLVAVEVKSSATIASDFFKGLTFFGELAGVPPEHRFVVYGGEEVQSRTSATVLPWRQLDELIAVLLA